MPLITDQNLTFVNRTKYHNQCDISQFLSMFFVFGCLCAYHVPFVLQQGQKGVLQTNRKMHYRLHAKESNTSQDIGTPLTMQCFVDGDQLAWTSQLNHAQHTQYPLEQLLDSSLQAGKPSHSINMSPGERMLCLWGNVQQKCFAEYKTTL